MSERKAAAAIKVVGLIEAWEKRRDASTSVMSGSIESAIELAVGLVEEDFVNDVLEVALIAEQAGAKVSDLMRLVLEQNDWKERGVDG